jgi:hypothetical protein
MSDSPVWKQWIINCGLSALFGLAGGGIVRYASVNDVKDMIDDRLATEERVRNIEDKATDSKMSEVIIKIDALTDAVSKVRDNQIRAEVRDEDRDKRIGRLEATP